MGETITDPAATPVASPIAVFKKRGAKGKAHIRKRQATPPPVNSDSNSDYSSSADESDKRIKRRKRSTGTVTASSKHNPEPVNVLPGAMSTAERHVPLSDSNDATKQSNWYDEESKDVLSAKSLLGTTRAMSKESQTLGGTYKGLANQTSFIQKNPNAPARTVGPVKAPTNIRTITVTDFAPDVCKDYKQTGFCGFGDSCKYLHLREDYKQGWQLDREWENVTKGKKNFGGTIVASADRSKNQEEDDDDDEAVFENIPFVCLICKEDYKSPVITRCGHYFCEPCALKRYRSNPSCAQCGAGTGGVFNSGKRLQKLLAKKRERAVRRQEALERGEEISEEEES